jgi:hypothetical protein
MSPVKIVTCAWKRPNVLALSLTNWNSLVPKPEIVVMGSPEDECEQLAKEFGCRYFTTENKPLGRKWNQAMIEAGHLGHDDGTTHYLIMGSDDLISQRTWEYLQTVKDDFIALKDFYFYSVEKKIFIHFKGYMPKQSKFGHGLGAGKLISHKALLSIGFHGFEDRKESGLDFDIDLAIRRAGYNERLLTLAETGGICVDLKTQSNMHKFRVYPNSIVYPYTEFEKRDKELWEIVKNFTS